MSLTLTHNSTLDTLNLKAFSAEVGTFLVNRVSAFGVHFSKRSDSMVKLNHHIYMINVKAVVFVKDENII